MKGEVQCVEHICLHSGGNVAVLNTHTIVADTWLLLLLKHHNQRVDPVVVGPILDKPSVCKQ